MVRQVLSDESLNDRGFRVMNKSIKWDRYLKNPVLVEQHMSWEPPIGRIDDIKLENDAWTVFWYSLLLKKARCMRNYTMKAI